MSIKLVNQVYALGVPGDLQPVLVALASFAADDGSNVYPSVEKLASMCGRSRATIHRKLRILRDAGILVTVIPGGGRKLSTHYRLDLSDPETVSRLTQPGPETVSHESPFDHPETVSRTPENRLSVRPYATPENRLTENRNGLNRTPKPSHAETRFVMRGQYARENVLEQGDVAKPVDARDPGDHGARRGAGAPPRPNLVDPVALAAFEASFAGKVNAAQEEVFGPASEFSIDDPAFVAAAAQLYPGIRNLPTLPRAARNRIGELARQLEGAGRGVSS